MDFPPLWTEKPAPPRFLGLGHGLLLYGHYAKRVGVNQGFSCRQLYVIYNSVDYQAQKILRDSSTPEDLAAIRRALFASWDRPLLICCAIFRERSVWICFWTQWFISIARVTK